AGVVMRRFDARHVCLLRHAGDLVDDVLPRVAAVAAHLQVAIIGADPDDARHNRRFTDGDDVAERRGTIVLGCHRCRTLDAENWSIVPADILRQIRRRDPRLAAIVRAEQAITTQVYRSWIVWR